MKFLSRNLLTCCVGFVLTIPTATQAQAVKLTISPEVAYVASGIENARLQLKCGQADVAFSSFQPKELWDETLAGDDGAPDAKQPSRDHRQSYIGRWYYQSPKLAMIIQVPSINPDDGNLYRFFTDGTKVQLLYQLVHKGQRTVTSDNLQSDGAIYPPEEVLFGGTWKDRFSLDPRSYMDYMNTPASKTLPQFMLTNPSQFLGEEAVFGARCSKIQVRSSQTRRVVFYFDVEHGFLLRKAEQYEQSDGQELLLSEWQMPEIWGSNGVWIPATVENKYYWGVLFKQKDAEPIVYKFTTSNFQANCTIPDEVFEFEWPLNTFVRDRISGKEFVVAAQQPPAYKDQAGRDQQAQEDKAKTTKKEVKP